MLIVQQDAPDFTLNDANSKQHQLADYKGQWLIVYFYPKDNTPGCTTEACTLRDDNTDFEKLNAKIVGISTDTSKSHLKFIEKQSLPFTLLADTTGEVSKAYDALFKLGPLKVSKRHSFIIDPTGKIAKIYRSVSPGLHSQELLVDLQQLQKNFK
ncbi:MAG: peroxiredoxin Q/BCP [Methyloprofundus sp.]|nr:MAG: peroxiredoxin Q/BCP [Methyloprofundus sp.]